MADTLKRTGHVFPEIKRGDTNPYYEIPGQTVDAYEPGSTGLAQLRRLNGDLMCNLAVVFAAGKFGLAPILPGNTRRIPSDTYIIELQIITPEGAVTTEVNDGRITVVGDNCFDASEEALIVFSDADPSPALGMRLKSETFAFDGAGPYETQFPPNGMVALLFLDIGFEPSSPIELNPTGFTLVGIASGVETVTLLYSY